MAQPRRIERSIQLLVEGKDQLNFFEAFIRRVELQNELQVQDFGGVNELRGFLRALADSPEFDTVESVGIVRDAEQSAAGARRSVTDSLQHVGLPAPGDASRGNGPLIHLLILPGGGEERGMLETLLCRSVADRPLNDCIDEFFECADALPGIDIRRLDKARAQAYLAMQPEPQVSVGVAAQKGYWPLDHDAFAEVRDFLAGL